MAELLKSWRIWVLFTVIFIAVGIVAFNGLKFGIDFKGGTLFQIHLAKKVPNMETVTQVIESRLNWSGLKDVRIYGAENEFVFVIVPETSDEDVKRIESLIRKQGRFEVMIDGNVMLTGKGIINVDQQPNIAAFERLGDGSFVWRLPFTLSISAAEHFRDLAFHKCQLVNVEKSDYDCALTYFFIDRPTNAVLVMSRQRFDEDKSIFLAGTDRIPRKTSIKEVLLNAGTPYFIVDKNGLSPKQLSELKKVFAERKTAIVQAELPDNVREQLKSIGYKVKEAKSTDLQQPGMQKVPWIYRVTGLKSIVRLQPGVTGNKPYAEKPSDAQIITDLFITSHESNYEAAKAERSETKIILNSGSLPVAVESISHFWTSPTQGKEFLTEAAIIGLIVLITVSMIIFLRYKHLKLSMAIIFTSLVEAFVTLSFTSGLGQSIDLAAIAGIIAAVGTGVDDQIVITDELLKGEEEEHVSLLRRAKRAFFIIVASAATTLATMIPIILFGYVMVKLVGFAIAITIGVLVGVLVTRPAYGEIARYILGEY